MVLVCSTGQQGWDLWPRFGIRGLPHSFSRLIATAIMVQQLGVSTASVQYRCNILRQPTCGTWADLLCRYVTVCRCVAAEP